jgi:hypothetical protein
MNCLDDVLTAEQIPAMPQAGDERPERAPHSACPRSASHGRCSSLAAVTTTARSRLRSVRNGTPLSPMWSARRRRLLRRRGETLGTF